MEPTVVELQNWLRKHESELLSDTREMLRIPSVESEPAPGAPFGAENRRALDLALQLGDKYGFSTKNLDGFVGYAEVGSGQEVVLSLGHLDVVPVGEGWKHHPFGAELDGEFVYARGAVDDKGPTLASFYAMRAIHEVCGDLGVRLRQVFGCNEESGFKCVEHYKSVEEAPTYGVAPDSGWPLYYAEKGIANLHISLPAPGASFKVTLMKGGSRPNIVIDLFTVEVEVSPSIRADIEEGLKSSWDANLSISWRANTLVVVAKGKAAHGSTPFFGDSAATRAFRLLLDLAPVAERPVFEALLGATHPSGVGIGIHHWDDATEDLTSNLGVVDTVGGRVTLLVNIRYPVTWNIDDLTKACRAKLAKLDGDWSLDDVHDSPGLYFPLDHPLTKTIVEVYRQEGGTEDPATMGGGTYARAIPNTVSIGTGWEANGDGRAHEVDERLNLQSLYRMSRIYAHIFWRLALLAKSGA